MTTTSGSSPRRRGRRLQQLVLREGDDRVLRDEVTHTDRRRALRARVALLAAAGESNVAIARQLGLSLPTVGKWRERYRTEGVSGLEDPPRRGPKKALTESEAELVIARTLEVPRPNRPHPTARRVAGELGLSKSSIARIWHRAGLDHRIVDLQRRPVVLAPAVGKLVGIHMEAERAVLAYRRAARGFGPGNVSPHRQWSGRRIASVRSPFVALSRVLGTTHREPAAHDLDRFLSVLWLAGDPHDLTVVMYDARLRPPPELSRTDFHYLSHADTWLQVATDLYIAAARRAESDVAGSLDRFVRASAKFLARRRPSDKAFVWFDHPA